MATKRKKREPFNPGFIYYKQNTNFGITIYGMIRKAYKNGLAEVFAFSEACPSGEYGTAYWNELIPISKDKYFNAANRILKA